MNLVFAEQIQRYDMRFETPLVIFETIQYVKSKDSRAQIKYKDDILPV